jgi:DNA-binding MarR family transcriptional regulator
VNAGLRGLADLDRVIHEPSRLIVVALLSAVEEADFVYLRNETGLTTVNLSSHLGKLEAAGYVTVEKSYRNKVPLTLCRLTEQGRNAFQQYRTTLKAGL